MADDSIISYSDLIGDDGTFDEILKNIKKIEKELISSAKRIKKEFSITNPNDVQRIQQLEKEVNELAQANKNLAKATATVNKAKKQSAELTQEQLIQQEALKLEKREATRIAKQQAIILKEEGNTIKSLRAQLSLITIQWSKLTAEELKNTKKGKELVATKKRLTSQLKALEKATGDARRNVGNYTSALGKLGKTAAAVFVGRSIVDGVKRLTSAFGNLVTQFRESNSTIGGIGKAFDKAGSSLQFAGVKILEFLAPALEKIAELVSLLPPFFAGVGAAAAQLGTNISAQFNKIGLNLELIFAKLERSNPFSSKNTAQIEANIRRIERAIESQSDRQLSLSDAYNEAYNKVLAEQEAFIKEQEEKDKRAAAKKAAEEKKRIEEQAKRELETRIKAIEALNRELRRLEAENTKDAQERALALEQLRFEEEQKLRKSQLSELEMFFKDSQDKLNEIADLRRKIDEESEEQHQKNILAIRKQYAIETIEIAALTQEEIERRRQEEIDNFNKQYGISTEELKRQQEEIAEENARVIEENQKKQRESAEATLKQIGETAEKIGQEIVNLLEKQADVAEQNVNAQVDNLDRARERAANGLEANLAFEEAELSKRRAEQQQAEKRAQQAAKLLALFNLVSAYAQSGDENALFRGLADFAILEAFSAGLQGFYEGTEDTGTTLTPLDNKGGRLAILHDNERVMTKAQNTLLNGMSNDMVVQNALLGEQMSDYFNPQSITNQNLFSKQKEDFVKSMQGGASVQNNSSEMVKHLKRIETQLANQPNFSLELEKLYEGVYGMVKEEIRTNFKKISRYKLKGRI